MFFIREVANYKPNIPVFDDEFFNTVDIPVGMYTSPLLALLFLNLCTHRYAKYSWIVTGYSLCSFLGV